MYALTQSLPDLHTVDVFLCTHLRSRYLISIQLMYILMYALTQSLPDLHTVDVFLCTHLRSRYLISIQLMFSYVRTYAVVT